MSYENIEINIQGSPGPWLKHKGKFYCYFRTDNDKFSTDLRNHFFIFDKNGNIESEIMVPEKLQTSYYDLYLKNGSIFTTEYYNKNTFLLDEENKQWTETKKASNLFFEDDDYRVYSLDLGEWGGVTWFEDKKTKKQFEVAISSPIVNRLDNSYFLTAENKVLKIVDPQKLELSKEPYEYKKAVLQPKYFRKGSNSLKGAEVIYEYKSVNYINPKLFFITSFVCNDKLYHIYKDSINIKIGTIDNNLISPADGLNIDINPLRWYYDWRNPIQNNKSQTIQFRTKNKNEYGVIEINGKDLLITTFKNSYREPELGDIRIKEWFEKSFDFYYANFGNLFLNEIDSIEQKENATNLTQRHKISHYLLDGKSVETPRIYRKIEDSCLQLYTSYYYSTKQKSIELIEFEWGRNMLQSKSITNITADSISDQKLDSLCKSKFDWISNFISAKIENANRESHAKKDATQEWTTHNKIVKLFLDSHSTKLIMYKGKKANSQIFHKSTNVQNLTQAFD